MTIDQIIELIQDAITSYENDSGEEFTGDVYDLSENIQIALSNAGALAA